MTAAAARLRSMYCARNPWRVSWLRSPCRNWSAKQQEAMDYIDAQRDITDANKLAQAHRVVAIAGEPGSGKSELLAHAAVRAAEQGCHALILRPTGSLVHSLRDRLPDTEKIMVEKSAREEHQSNVIAEEVSAHSPRSDPDAEKPVGGEDRRENRS